MTMPRESWELWADDYQERDEGKFDYAEEYTKDDISQWKEEEQKMIDDLCKRMEKAYNDA
jgi:hypothetical protein